MESRSPVPEPSLTADEVATRLDLAPHPEGGWFRRTWSDESEDGSRGAASVIHFLLRSGEVARWHRIDAAEVWVHVCGDPLELSWVEDGRRRHALLGGGLAEGQVPHAVVPAQAWQAARPVGAWSLVTCMVAPAFDWAGFEIADAGPDESPPD